MKIYKVIVDKKPEDCFFCPIKSTTIKIEMPFCGEKVAKDIGDGWVKTCTVPDERCLLQERMTYSYSAKRDG